MRTEVGARVSDRYKALTVVLDDDIRDDDAEAIIAAIRMVKRVAGVTPVETEPSDYLVRARFRREIAEKLQGIIKELYR